MKRRTTLKYLGAGAVAGIAGVAGWRATARDPPELSVDLVLERLRALDPGRMQATGAWEAARTFDHLAQSVGFSMTGYPQLKPKLFRRTVGPAAFALFNARGRMTHGLDEPIPGEVIAAAGGDMRAALTRLTSSLEAFRAFDGPMMPHFAYGTLDKAQYGTAHVLHINNHLEAFRSA